MRILVLYACDECKRLLLKAECQCNPENFTRIRVSVDSVDKVKNGTP